MDTKRHLKSIRIRAKSHDNYFYNHLYPPFQLLTKYIRSRLMVKTNNY